MVDRLDLVVAVRGVRATVDKKVVTGDVPGHVGCEEHDGRDDFADLAETTHRGSRCDPLVHSHALEGDAGHFGDDEAGADCIDSHTAVGPFAAELLGDVAQSTLCRGVGDDVHLVCAAAHDRADVDDVAALLQQHVQADFAHVEECATQVDGHDVVERIGGEALGADSLHVGDARVVDQRVDAAEFFDARCDHALHVVFDRDVAGDAQNLCAELATCLAGLFEEVLAAGGEDQVCACAREALSKAGSEAVRGSGDENGLSLEVEHFCPLTVPPEAAARPPKVVAFGAGKPTGAG